MNRNWNHLDNHPSIIECAYEDIQNNDQTTPESKIEKWLIWNINEDRRVDINLSNVVKELNMLRVI